MKIWKILVAIVVAVMGVGLIMSSPAMADDIFGCDDPSVPDSAKEAMGCLNVGSDEQVFPKAIEAILKIIIGIGGVVAMSYIIVGGIKYMTSSGDSSKLKAAKDTILYALIGLIIAALAFVLTNWAIELINESAEAVAPITTFGWF